jgi:hypothetical protein
MIDRLFRIACFLLPCGSVIGNLRWGDTIDALAIAGAWAMGALFVARVSEGIGEKR